MGILSILVSVAFLIYLLLRIERMTTRSRSTVASAPTPSRASDLPDLSEAEIQTQLATMPTKWVSYEGMTPPLKLRIRGLNRDLYRLLTRAEFERHGYGNPETLSRDVLVKVVEQLHPIINANNLVVDWNGAQYPNGNPMPYSPDNLVILMRKDPFLSNFIAEEAGKLGPEDVVHGDMGKGASP